MLKSLRNESITFMCLYIQVYFSVHLNVNDSFRNILCLCLNLIINNTCIKSIRMLHAAKRKLNNAF